MRENFNRVGVTCSGLMTQLLLNRMRRQNAGSKKGDQRTTGRVEAGPFSGLDGNRNASPDLGSIKGFVIMKRIALLAVSCTVLQISTAIAAEVQIGNHHFTLADGFEI